MMLFQPTMPNSHRRHAPSAPAPLLEALADTEARAALFRLYATGEIPCTALYEGLYALRGESVPEDIIELCTPPPEPEPGPLVPIEKIESAGELVKRLMADHAATAAALAAPPVAETLPASVDGATTRHGRKTPTPTRFVIPPMVVFCRCDHRRENHNDGAECHFPGCTCLYFWMKES